MADPLLRPNQLKEYEEVHDSLKAKLNNKFVQDKTAVRHQLKRVERDLERQAPKEIPTADKDAVIKETDKLLETIQEGMPSSEEMRKCPPGAIYKHMQWEKRNKKNIQDWKTNRLRLNVGTDDPDVANLEMHRPEKSELNMQSAFIPGKQFHLGTEIGVATVLSDEDLALIKERAPEEIYGKLCLMDAEGRAIVKAQFVTSYEAPVEEKAEPEAKQEAEPVETKTETQATAPAVTSENTNDDNPFAGSGQEPQKQQQHNRGKRRNK